MLREPVTLNTGFWNPKNFYGLVQQKGPWPNQLIDDLKRQPQPLPEGPVGKGGTRHAGHNYWELDTSFMSDIHTLGDTGSLKYHHAPAIIKGKPFVGGGASLRRIPKKKQTFLDPNTLAHFAQLAEFLGKYPGDGEPKDADIKTEKLSHSTTGLTGLINNWQLKSPSESLGGLGTFDKEQKNIGTSPYLPPAELNIPGIKEEKLDELARQLKELLEKSTLAKIDTNLPRYKMDVDSYDTSNNAFKEPLVNESFKQPSPKLISNSWAQTSPVTPTDVIMVDNQGLEVMTQTSPATPTAVIMVDKQGIEVTTQTSPVVDKKAKRELLIQKGLMEKIFRINRKNFGGPYAKRFKKADFMDIDKEVVDVDVQPDGTITNTPSLFTSSYWESVEQEATELSHFTNVLAANEARRNTNTQVDVDETSTIAGSPTESLRGMAIPIVSTPIVVSNGVVDSRRPTRIMGQTRKPQTIQKKTKGVLKVNTTAVAGPSKPSFDVYKKFEIISPSSASTTPRPLPTQTLPLPPAPKPKRKYTKKKVSAVGSIASRTRSKKGK